MTLKRWLTLYVLFMFIAGAFIGGLNAAIDPFGIFGDKFMDWYAYNMTNNPRVSKIGYLDENHDKYDSYIVGCSKTSSISKDALNKYYKDAKFYNMIMYGGDMYDIEKTVYYIVDNYKAKNIIVNMGLEEGNNYHQVKDPLKQNLHAKVEGTSLIKFYSKYFFANPEYSYNKVKGYFTKGYLPGKYTSFTPETGSYSKIVRDVEPISDMDEYLKNNPDFNEKMWPTPLSSIDLAVGSIKRIKEHCEANNVSFMLIASPVTGSEVGIYEQDKLIEYWKKIADITSFWDFSGYNSLSSDPRFFYDNLHFRNSVGDMVLARIFNDKSIYVPENFGHYTTKDNVDEYAKKIFTAPKTKFIDYTKKVPILMYHQLDEDESKCNEYTVSPGKFRKDMENIKKTGYNSVSFKDLLDYVETGKELPLNPILITFDDGYTNVYKFAYPILKELNMKATISLIGNSVGKDIYKNSSIKISPHFSYDDAKEMYTSGLIDIQSHSYDMHDNETLQKEIKQSFREGILKKEGESEQDYVKTFKDDYLKSKNEIEKNVGNKIFVYVYPFGKNSTLSEALLKEMDNKITVTTNDGINTVIKGLPQSLYSLKRINVPFNLKSEDLLEKINSYMK